MIEPEALQIGQEGTLDAGPINNGDAYLVGLRRESSDTWVTRRFPIPSGVGTARISRDPAAPMPWTVKPFDPLIDGEEFETWREALMFAMRLPVPK